MNATEREALRTIFSNGKWAVNVKTVGQLIDELARLPRDLRVEGDFAESVDVHVANINRDDVDPHVGFDDGGEWTDEEDDDELGAGND